MNGTIYSTIVGTIVADPAPYYKVKGDSEIAGCSFRVAINRCTKVNNNWETYTQFIEITCRDPYRAKFLLNSQWCKKGFHAYFMCDQSERMYTKKDGTEVRIPMFSLMDAHPILVSESYAQQKSAQLSQERTRKDEALHQAVGAPGHQPVPMPRQPQSNMAEDDIPF